MVRHVSIFFLKEQTQENIEKMLQALRRATDAYPGVVHSTVAQAIAPERALPRGQGPAFGDVVQIIEFDSLRRAEDYPMSPAHLALMQETSELVQNVSVVDFEI